MQGKKEFEGRLFCDIDPMEVIGEDHLLVRLDNALDLGWIRQATKDYYSHTGRPSVDPVALVKMMCYQRHRRQPNGRERLEGVNATEGEPQASSIILRLGSLSPESLTSTRPRKR
jgi:hypothetical protein